MFDWLSDNWVNVVAALAAVHVAAVAVTRLTPTPKDDAFVAKAYAFVVRVGSIFSVKK